MPGRMTRPATSPGRKVCPLAAAGGGGGGGGGGVPGRRLLLRPLGLGSLAADLVVPLGAHDFGGGLVVEGDECEAAVPPG